MSHRDERPHIHVASILERATNLHPRREALVWGEDRLTYAGLSAAADTVAARLEDQGLEPPDRVALLGRNNIGMTIGLVALSLHGFEAVPLNWRFSDHALAETSRKYGPKAVLHSVEFAEPAERLCDSLEQGCTHVPVDDREVIQPDLGISERFRGRRHEPTREEIFAYISTGGTEGVPKGIPVTNGMVEASVTGQVTTEEILDSDVSLILPQIFHNPHLYLVPPLFAGGTLVVPDMPSFDAELVLRTIESEGITRFLGVATMMAYLMDAQSRMGADVSSLRTISYGGAPFAAQTVRRLVETFDCGLLQLYGQTEASVLISTLRPEDHFAAISDPEDEYLLTSAGKPIPLVDVRVEDTDGSLCPRDRSSVGEIVYRTPSAMEGYYRDPEKTAAVKSGEWIRSGDLATWDRGGYLFIVDRRGDMIITGGENVFPSAIEDVIRELDGVEEAVVIGTPDETWGEIVTAVVLTSAGQEVGEDDIKARCDERLAGYMRPRIFHFVDDLPKNPSGKVMRGEVKRLYARPPEGGGSVSRL